jgi:hypothetical protein
MENDDIRPVIVDDLPIKHMAQMAIDTKPG